MRKLLLAVVLLTAFAFTAKSQSENYHAFKFDLMAGYALPAAPSGTSKGGVAITLHPHYRITDQIAVGLRMDAALMGYTNSDGSGTNTKISALASYSGTLEYYLSDGDFRPFVGAGAGLFKKFSASSDDTIDLTYDDTTGDYTATGFENKNKFGFFPEVGFEYSHFRVNADYNFLPNKSGYLGIKIGFFFGGGSKGYGYY